VKPGDALYLGGLGVLACERLFELRLSSRNARTQLTRGAEEFGRSHFPAMVALHSLFLAACAAELWLYHPPLRVALALPAFAVALAAQGLRYWAVYTLGDRWNTRIIARRGDAPVTGGPYRYLRHPNYLAVVLELAAVPLIHGCWRTALAFSVGNAILLAVRIPAEERALGELYQSAFAGRPRFVPEAQRGR
jgi:methyltransferase